LDNIYLLKNKKYLISDIKQRVDRVERVGIFSQTYKTALAMATMTFQDVMRNFGLKVI
jgi:hypothetical protein